MSIEPTIVLSRLKFMSDYLRELRRFETMTLEEYLDSFEQKIISERILELVIQSALDINEHLLTKGFQVESATNKQSFLNLGKYNIITLELAEELSLSAGVRNILAHQYLSINYELLFEHIQKTLTVYPQYISQIANYLDNLRN
ncbi:MAG: DUF86 domain-containing protein [Xenococcaceae cyanobacterium]